MIAMMGLGSCTHRHHYQSYEDYPCKRGSLREVKYALNETQFTLWSPNADSVTLQIYDNMRSEVPIEVHTMSVRHDGTWEIVVRGDLIGKGYTFLVREADSPYPLHETPGIFATAVGVNGRRAAIYPDSPIEGTKTKTKTNTKTAEPVIIYEMHYRDMTAHASAGVKHPGKFLAFTEHGTVSPEGLATGIDHLKELGVTHVQLLPSYDYGSIDEAHLVDNRYNWGYDPVNYNVPEGSYSTNPYDPACRVQEFKQMIQALHEAGIKVVMDVVYNHTYDVAESNFTQTVPGYFYRTRENGSLGNASGCGNETASEREMMRRFMVESVCYWATEYGIDGFRFDLMAIHDIETMKAIRAALDKINPTILTYGEGWAAETPLTPVDIQPIKANVHEMPRIGAFSDELRDGLRGSCWDDKDEGFLSGKAGCEQSIRFGVVGAIAHPGVDMTKVNYSQKPWAKQPTQMIAYASCHDDMMLTDRLRSCVRPKRGKVISDEELMRLDMLAQTIVMTSQGIPFIWNGEEIMRDKKGVHNSFCSPDAVNAIDWSLKAKNKALFDYYCGLIAMRKAHPAFWMGKADLVRKNVTFLDTPDCVVAYRIQGEAVKDSWKDIIVVVNANRHDVRFTLPTTDNYTAVLKDGEINLNGLGEVQGEVTVAAQRALILIKQ